MVSDPAADATDVYAWVDSTSGDLVVVANFIGLELPEGGPNWASFSDDVLYEIHIARGPSSLADALTYQFQFKTTPPVRRDPSAYPPVAVPAGGLEFFAQLAGTGASNQTYTVTQLTNGASPTVLATNVPVAPPNVGAETNAVVYQFNSGTYESHFVGSGQVIGTLANNGGKVFAGPRDDPFFADLGAIMDLAQLRQVVNPSSVMPIRDSLAYTNVHSIVLQIPGSLANGGNAVLAGAHAAQTLGIWASSSRRKLEILRKDGTRQHYGPWVQVSRLGLPLINEAVIGLQDKDLYNALTPSTDLATFGAYFLNPIIVRDADALGFYANTGPLAACATAGGNGPQTNRTDIIQVINLPDHTGSEAITSVGDVLRVDLGQTSGFPNGRLLTDTVVQTELELLLCGAGSTTTFPVGPTANEASFQSTFPYLATPWEGRTATPRPAPSAAP